MKNKFDEGCLNFGPSGRFNQLNILLDIFDINNSNLEFKWPEDVVYSKSAINSNSELISEKTSSAIADALIETQIELAEKWEMYIYMLNNGLINQPFPFKEWDVEIFNIETGCKDIVHIELDNILEGISQAGNSSNPAISSLAYTNLSAFLGTKLDKNFQNRKYFKLLDYVLSEKPQNGRINFQTFDYFVDQLSETVENEHLDQAKMRLVRFASRLIRVKSRPINKFSKVKKEIGLEEKNKYSQIELKEDMLSFIGTSLWYTIYNNPTYLENFISEITSPNKDFNLFCSVGASPNGDLVVTSYKKDNIELFFDNLVKDDKEFGNLILKSLEKHMPNNLSNEYNEAKMSAEKILKFYELNNTVKNNIPKPVPSWLKV